MSKLSEEEIIDILKNKLFFGEYEFGLNTDEENFCETGYDAADKVEKAIQGLLDLYNKEKEKNNETKLE